MLVALNPNSVEDLTHDPSRLPQRSCFSGKLSPHPGPAKDSPKTITNSIGTKFVWIPPGTFMMGSPKEEKGRESCGTQHKVTLTKGFYMGVFTVTEEQWAEVMDGLPSEF